MPPARRPLLEVAHPPGRDAERAYALGVVLGEFLGLGHTARAQERADFEIRLAGEDDGRRLRVADGLLGIPADDWLRESSLPVPPLAHVDLRSLGVECPGVLGPLPVLHGTARDAVRRTSEGIDLELDVFGSAFFLLTRYEEIASPARDDRDRFPAAASLASRAGFLDRPLANEYAELLGWALRALWPRLPGPQRRFRLLPSHDVDAPRARAGSGRAIARAAAGDVVRRRDPVLAVDRLRAGLAVRTGAPDRDLNNTFDFLMDVSEDRGETSAFYFMAAATRPELDGDYSLWDSWISRLLRRIHERGHEIGLHPSYETFRDPAQLAREFRALRTRCAELDIDQPAWGGRQHYLRWENPTTWRAWDEAGLDYDSSLGFAETPGFRTGSCLEYPAFDLLARRPLRLRERPLVAMEASLLEYQGLAAGQIAQVLAPLRERCRRMRGDFTLLWHNDRLASRRDRAVYRGLVLGERA